MFLSNLYDGDARAGGSDADRSRRARAGRILNSLAKGNDNRPAGSLYLSLMVRMGVQPGRFGVTAALPGLRPDAAQVPRLLRFGVDPPHHVGHRAHALPVGILGFELVRQ